MITSNYIYGEATNNMHGKLSDAVEAGILSAKEAEKYDYYASCVMSGRLYKGEFPESIQFKLDEFFKKDELDYEDFERQCKELSGDRFVTVSSPDLFKSGRHCYYTEKGETINVCFVSRFTKKN